MIEFLRGTFSVVLWVVLVDGEEECFTGIPFIFARASCNNAPISTPLPCILFTISSNFDLSSV